jgi:hypothetical protein
MEKSLLLPAEKKVNPNSIYIWIVVYFLSVNIWDPSASYSYSTFAIDPVMFALCLPFREQMGKTCKIKGPKLGTICV